MCAQTNTGTSADKPKLHCAAKDRLMKKKRLRCFDELKFTLFVSVDSLRVAPYSDWIDFFFFIF